MTLLLDWWQLGWVLAGFFLVMFLALAASTRGQSAKAQRYGQERGWHDRQHWEGDELLKSAIHSAFENKKS